MCREPEILGVIKIIIIGKYVVVNCKGQIFCPSLSHTQTTKYSSMVCHIYWLKVLNIQDRACVNISSVDIMLIYKI